MPWSFVAAGTVATGANPTVGLPAGWAQGQLLVLVGANGGGGNTFTTPSGWTAGGLNGGGSGSTNLSVWYKIAGASESSVSLNNSNESRGAAVMLAYSGIVSASSGLDVAGTFNGATSTSLSTNSLTTTVVNDLVISAFSIRTATGQALTAGSGYTSRVNYTGGASFVSLLVGDENKATAGATTSRTATAAASARWDTFAISFKQVPSNGNFLVFF